MSMTPAVLSGAARTAAGQGDGGHPALRAFFRDVLRGPDWSARGAVIIDHLPVGNERTASAAVEACSRAMGTLLPQDAAGATVREVRYRGVGLGQGATGRYSDSRQGGHLHTDGPHRHGRPPEIFTLLCVRQSAVGGALVLVETNRIVRALRAESALVLQQPFFFDRREPGTRPVRRPILHRSASGHWQLNYLRTYVELGHRHEGVAPLTSAQCAALDDLDSVVTRLADADDGHQEVKLSPGQMVVIDNMRLLHGRTAFGDDETDRDRLMLRTWIQPITS